MNAHSTEQISLARLALLVALTQVVSVTAFAEPPPKEFADGALIAAVERALVYQSDAFPNDVDVSVAQGIVTLSGTVPNLLAHDRDRRIAESLRGVRGVIDELVVRPVVRADAEIRENIIAALAQDAATGPYHLQVAVTGAMATLTGSVGSFAGKQLAERIAKGVAGLKGVHGDITFNYAAKRTDAEMLGDVRGRLQWDIWTNGNLIVASVRDGHVALSGAVGSANEKTRAYADAWVVGVTSVDDQEVRIDPWARNGARRTLRFVSKSDADIQHAVQACLLLDPRVAAPEPSVEVEAGEVFLSGLVGDLRAREAAGQDAQDTVGVWRVTNVLKVRPQDHRLDLEVEKRLRVALAWDPAQVGSTIETHVIDGVVSLRGTVESVYQRTDAQELASRTQGVVAVRNHLNVEPQFTVSERDFPGDSYGEWPNPADTLSQRTGPMAADPYPTDEQIQKNIEGEFLWSPFVERNEVKVAVHGGMATLTGTVGTRLGWREADRDARRYAPGLRNNIIVKSGSWW